MTDLMQYHRFEQHVTVIHHEDVTRTALGDTQT